MTRICIVGGALQGMEATYLSKKAGFETVVIDSRPNAPALSLCDESHVLDPVSNREEFRRIARTCDAVLPANENYTLLQHLNSTVPELGIPLLFDIDAYCVSCSKLLSNEVMADAGIPLPRKWPCEFPVVVKPSSQSGSIGVSVVNNTGGMASALAKITALNDDPVIEEYVRGRNVSLEVIGNGSEYNAYDLTEVVLSDDYDCKMVKCDPSEDAASRNELGSYAVRAAERLHLNGIMDIEAIEGPNGMRVLEIDARLPSQTPAAIYNATGTNLVAELAASRGVGSRSARREGVSIYEHIVVRGKRMSSCGEKCFSHVDSPYFVSRFFGSTEAITDYLPGKEVWYATLMFSANNTRVLKNMRSECINSIIEDCRISDFIDRCPKVMA